MIFLLFLCWGEQKRKSEQNMEKDNIKNPRKIVFLGGREEKGNGTF